MNQKQLLIYEIGSTVTRRIFVGEITGKTDACFLVKNLLCAEQVRNPQTGKIGFNLENDPNFCSEEPCHVLINSLVIHWKIASEVHDVDIYSAYEGRMKAILASRANIVLAQQMPKGGGIQL